MALFPVVCLLAMPLAIHGDRLEGPGAEWLLSVAKEAQFVLLGEEQHDARDIPLFDLALVKALKFPHVAVEQDPVGIEMILQPAYRGQPQRMGELLHRYPTLLGFASDQDLEFLAAAGGSIWGLEQAQSPAAYLTELIRYAPNADVQSIAVALLNEAQTKESTRADFGKFIAADPTALDKLTRLRDAFKAKPESRADFLLGGLVKSAEIYSYYRRAEAGERVGLFNNTVREAWLKLGFLRHYRTARDKRAIFKLGANHLGRGLNATNAWSLGNLLHELAISNGKEAFGIDLWSLEAGNLPEDFSWLKPLLPGKVAPMVIDLVALRPVSRSLIEKLPEKDREKLRREIFSWEALVMLPSTGASTWSYTGFAPQ
jgi:hypothetical protein